MQVGCLPNMVQADLIQAQPNTEVNYLQDKLYRKYQVYSMGWAGHVDLSTQMVAGAATGGPIAMIRDESQIHRATSEAKPTIQIYTSAGQLISEFWWESPEHLVHMGWTEKEELVCVVS